MGKVVLVIETKPEPRNDYIIVDGENYLLLEFEDYGLGQQAARFKLDRATEALFAQPGKETQDQALLNLDNFIRLIVPTLPAKKIKALREEQKIIIANAYYTNWSNWSTDPKLYRPLEVEITPIEPGPEEASKGE